MTVARDVLMMVAGGLQRGCIKSPSIEMMYSDGPKRVELLQLVMQALSEFALPDGPAGERVPEPPRAPLTPLSAHPALAAASEYTETCAMVERQQFGTQGYYDALARCDAAWERIAAACGVKVDAA